MSDDEVTQEVEVRSARVGERLLVVIVECACTDRWWAQPEGSYFPVCSSCGQEARPRGFPSERYSKEDHYPTRREQSIGGILTVSLEMDAVKEPHDG